MNAQEIQALKDLVDKVLPELEAAEVARLPAAYQPLASALVAALGPALQAALDAKIAAIVPA